MNRAEEEWSQLYSALAMIKKLSSKAIADADSDKYTIGTECAAMCNALAQIGGVVINANIVLMPGNDPRKITERIG